MSATSNRSRLLASTMMAGAFLVAASAQAQTTEPVAPSQSPSAGPIESQTTTSASAEPGRSASEIVVTGSRIVSPNLQSTSPITAVTSREFQLTGTTRAEDLVNSLPQAYASQSSGISNGSDGTATLNLRNLGDTRTLVLVDGRRLPPGDPSREAGSTLGSAADINNIPAFLVKRVDVLTGGASAAYGADAVAGVVNFILDRDFTGIKADAQTGLFAHDNANSLAQSIISADPRGFPFPRGSVNDGANYDASIALGTKFADDRGHVTIYGTYHQQSAVLQSARDYSSCGFSSTGTEGPRNGNLVCFGSRNSAAANFITDGGIGDTGAGSFIIDGSRGTPFTRNFAFGDRYNFGPLNFYQRPDTRYNAGAFASFDVSEAFQPYADFIYMKDRSRAQIAPSGTFGNIFTINCSNPLLTAGIAGALGCNTFGPSTIETVDASIFKRNVEGGGRVDDLEHRAFRVLGGFKGELGKAWSYDVYGQFGKTIYKEEYLNDFSGVRVQNALNACLNPNRSSIGDSACVPYNIFTGSTNIQPATAQGVSQGAIDYVQTPGRKNGYTKEIVASAVVNGQLGEYGIQSPFANDGVNIAIGVEYRKEYYKLNTDLAYSTGDLLGQGGETKSARGTYDVKEAFVELNAPVLTDRSGFQNLTLGAAYRYSYYSTVKSAHTWKFDFSWQPFAGDGSGLRLRGSINRAVRAPTLQDLYAPRQLGLNGTGDLCAEAGGDTSVLPGCLNTARNDPNFLAHFPTLAFNPASQYNGQTAGAITAGTSLKPEVAITKTIGAVFAPRDGALRGLSVSVDYYNIHLRDTIKTDGYDLIFSQCYSTNSDYYCGLIKRDPSNGSLWLGPGGYIIDPIYNAGRLRTSGIDVDVSYSRQFGGVGRISTGFTGGYLLNEKVEVLQHANDGSLSSLGFYNCVGYFGDACGSAGNGGEPSPKWRHKLRLTWEAPSGGFTLSGNWRHLGPTKWEALDPNPLQPSSGSNGSNTPATSDRIKAYNYFDLAASFAIARRFELRLGVNNIFDKDPPIINGADFGSIQVNGNTFPGMYDTLGRYVFAGVSVKL